MGYLRDLDKLIAENKQRIAKRKEKEAKEKEKHKQERIQRYKELCKQADQLLKEALQEEKKKKMEQLQALAPKLSQNALKQATEPSYGISRTSVYHTGYVERGFKDADLYQTREELKEAEERCEGRINWEAWDKSVEETRRQLKTTHFTPPPPKQRWDNRKHTVYAYDSKLNLLGEYPSATQCGKAFGLHSRSVCYWIEQGKPHKKLGLTFLTHKLSL